MTDHEREAVDYVWGEFPEAEVSITRAENPAAHVLTVKIGNRELHSFWLIDHGPLIDRYAAPSVDMFRRRLAEKVA